MKTRKKFTFSMPDTLVIIAVLIAVMCILTWLIPAGTFETDGNTIVAGTYQEVESNPATLWDFFGAFGAGMSRGASTIFMTLLIGGAFGVLIDTGTVHALLNAIVRLTRGNYVTILLCFTLMMSIFGVFGVGLNVQLAFAPIMLMVCSQLGLDGILVGATCYLAACTGAAASPINPLSVVLGQTIAGLAPMSGLLERTVLWVIVTVLMLWYVVRYARKIKLDPSKSLCGAYTQAEGDTKTGNELKASHIINAVLLVGVFAVYCYGSYNYNWQLSQLMTCMMILGICSGLIGGMNPNQISKSFTNGAKGMISAALMIGFASGINVIMSDANIIHSVIYYLCLPLEHLSSAAASVGMYIVNFIFNVFVTSGSGQCYIVMPILAPVADLLGVSRQIAVTAFQYGSGFCDLLCPHAGLLIGTLGIARVPFTKWVKFAVPYCLIMSVVVCIFLVIMNMIGWA